jgi:hypothetical protein
MTYSSSLSMRIQKVLLVIVIGLFLSGCTFTTILNRTSQPVRVAIMAPDGKGLRVVVLQPDDLKAVSTRIGGFYLIRALGDRTYINQLTDIQIRLNQYLLASNPPVSEYNKVLADIEAVRQKIKQAEDDAAKNAATCSGNLLDYSTLDATIYADAGSQKLSMTCVVVDFRDIPLFTPDE